MPYGDPPGWQQAYGPIWIDPRFYEQQKYRAGSYYWETTTDNVTRPYQPPPATPVDEERIRKIVREEIAELPIPFDVPDEPPEA